MIRYFDSLEVEEYFEEHGGCETECARLSEVFKRIIGDAPFCVGFVPAGKEGVLAGSNYLQFGIDSQRVNPAALAWLQGRFSGALENDRRLREKFPPVPVKLEFVEPVIVTRPLVPVQG